MTTKIGGITIDIDARLTKLESSLAKADRDLSRFEKSATASAKRTEQGILSISRGFGTLAGIAGGLGIAVGLEAIGSLSKATLDFADDLATAADQSLINVERFQTLSQAFRKLEIDGEQFNKAMLRLVSTLGDVQNGVESGATKALDKMGISAKILSGEIDSTDELLDAIAASSKDFATEAEFTSAVVDIFGQRAGPQMAAALREGGAALKAAEQDVRDFGSVLSEEQINRLADANESLDRFAEKAKYVFAIVASDAINYLGQAADAIGNFVTFAITGQAQLAKEAPVKGGAMGSGVGSLLSMGREAQRRVGTVASIRKNQAAAAAERGGGGGARRGGGGARAAKKETDEYGDALKRLQERLSDAQAEQAIAARGLDEASTAYAKVTQEAERLIAKDGTKWSETQKAAIRAVATDLAFLEASAERADAALGTLMDEVTAEQVIPQTFSDNIVKLIDQLGMKDAMKGQADGVLTEVERISQGFADMVARVDQSARSFADAIKSGNVLGIIVGLADTIASIGGAISGFKTLFGGVPGKAIGGPVGNRPYMVGENGPEMFLPNRGGGRIVPNSQLGRGGFKGGAGLSVQVIPGALFDVIIDQRAAGVAAPMALQAAGSSSFSTQATIARREKRRLA